MDGRPVRVYLEHRRNARVSIGRSAIHIRLPRFMSKRQQQAQVDVFLDWAARKLRERPTLGKTTVCDYRRLSEFRINDRVFPIAQLPFDGKLKASIKKGELQLSLPASGMDNDSYLEQMSVLVGHTFSKYFKDEVESRLRSLHAEHFDLPMGRVSLRNKSSNWGSCSSKGNISISTRLLFAPKKVQDYVFIHELAHLREMNHSIRFWRIVQSIDPEFKSSEKWLKENGARCFF